MRLALPGRTEAGTSWGGVYPLPPLSYIVSEPTRRDSVLNFLLINSRKWMALLHPAFRAHLQIHDRLQQKHSSDSCQLLSPSHAGQSSPYTASLNLPATRDVGVTVLICQGASQLREDSHVLTLP